MGIECTDYFGKFLFYQCFFWTDSLSCNVKNIGKEAKNLENILNQFWSLENIETKDNCVVQNFERDIFYNGQRYVTKLPFKLGHEFLPDNFSVCEQKILTQKN